MIENSKSYLLTVVMPIHRIDDRRAQLFRVVEEISSSDIQLVIVEDHTHYQFELKTELSSISNQNLTILSGNFGSPGLTRNFGMSHAKGKWICFWDSDDYPIVKEFLNMIRMAENQDAKVAAGFFANRSYKSDIVKVPRIRNAITLRTQILLNPGLWRFAFLASSLPGREFPDIQLAEDQYFLMDCIEELSDVALYPEVVYEYLVQSPAQITSQPLDRTQFEEALTLFASDWKLRRSLFHRFLFMKLILTYLKLPLKIESMRFLLSKLK